MRKFAFTMFSAVSLFAFSASAASITGFIADATCAAKQGAKTASEGHAACAAKCIKGGAAAVLVTEDGKIYKISDQSKVVDHAGQKVTIDGKVKGDTITVKDVKTA